MNRRMNAEPPQPENAPTAPVETVAERWARERAAMKIPEPITWDNAITQHIKPERDSRWHNPQNGSHHNGVYRKRKGIDK